MAKYRKKPIIIEAMQYENTLEGHNKILKWANSFPAIPPNSYPLNLTYYIAHGYLVVHTLEGNMEASPGDWIIKGIRGEFYPYKPDVFEATYEPVD